MACFTWINAKHTRNIAHCRTSGSTRHPDAFLRMKVLGLLSGGKDSCYNLMHCIANGHEVVALATLVPEEGIGTFYVVIPESILTIAFEPDELDSYLYQSVGTSLVTLIAQAMRLPLYRKTITGKPVHLESTYGSRTKDRSVNGQDKTRIRDGIEGDETEDLDELLHQVKVWLPTRFPLGTAYASASGRLSRSTRHLNGSHLINLPAYANRTRRFPPITRLDVSLLPLAAPRGRARG